ncbi:calcium/sodium antiporter [Kiloniella sp. b19]|uniref:calcium/sodium antiporter n=1 Tax=Kiloniella sp. GXU_MW_B19 TaxID=3141326 RepID=UPI0031D9852F
MTLGIAFLMVFGGLVALTVGGEVLLRGAVGIARNLGLSPMLIGLSIVAAATSMPELMVTVTAGLQDAADVGVGNVIGSNIANVLLILGVGALIAPIKILPCEAFKDAIAMLGATALFILFALTGELGPLQGLIMIAALVAYLAYSYWKETKDQGDDAEEEPSEEMEAAPKSLVIASFFIVAGILGLILGSDFLIDGALFIARAAGIPEVVIGLTLVALGTSLPELATVVVAGLRGHSDVALGNVLGSNIFNLLLILGVLALVSPFSVAQDVVEFDMWAMLASSLLVLPVMLCGGKICRSRGGLFLLLYALYIGYQFRDQLGLV